MFLIHYLCFFHNIKINVIEFIIYGVIFVIFYKIARTNLFLKGYKNNYRLKITLFYSDYLLAKF